MALPLFVERFFRKSLSHLLILEQRLVGAMFNGQGSFCSPSSESSLLPFVSNSYLGTGALRTSSLML